MTLVILFKNGTRKEVQGVACVYNRKLRDGYTLYYETVFDGKGYGKEEFLENIQWWQAYR